MYKMILSLLVLSFSLIGSAQNVGIGTTTPNASAVLDASSTMQGFLPPRMTYAQRNAIVNPAAGLIVYCTDCNGGAGEMNYFNGGIWMNMTIGIASNITVANLPSVRICGQIWMTKNLDVSTYRNGDAIPKVTDAATWAGLTSGAYCYYNNDSVTYAAVYGKLYNYYAVVDPRGLAPSGWHVPSNAEWTILDCLGGYTIAGGKMKEAGTSHWTTPNTGANNSSGFAGLPGGSRNYGTFYNIGSIGVWWSSTEYENDITSAWYRFLYYNNSDFTIGTDDKRTGRSVRCVRD